MTADAINNKISHANFYNHTLHNNPRPLYLQSEPYVVFLKEFNNFTSVEYSVVIPIFNQEAIIKDNIVSVLNNIEGIFELIIILDNCVDQTENIITEFFNVYNNQHNLVRVIIIKQETPIFETSCDNIGFVISSGKYVLEIQADMEMCQYGFNTSLARGFKQYEDIIGISGRCTHALQGAYPGVGKLGMLVNEPLQTQLCQNTLYMYGTCNRGPLLLDNKKLKYMGYLDEQNFYLDDSDHDFFARAYNNHKWKCGYIPIEFKAPVETGSIRKELISSIKQLNEATKELRRIRSNGGFLANVKNNLFIPIEVRKLK